MGIAFAHPTKEPDVVLVPPVFERNIRGRSRMAKSSYDYQFSKPALRWLFSDYILPDMRGVLNFRPPEDPRMSVRARFGDSLTKIGDSTAGSITIRLQRSVDDPFNFLDIKAAVQGSGSAQLRGCYFDGRTGVGTFAVLPIVSPDADADVAVQMGLRYNSPDASAGIILDPTKDQLHTLWAVGRYGSLTAGVQTSPQVTLGHVLSQATLQKGLENPRETLAAAWREAAPRTSFALAYSPSSGFASGKFTAALEVQEQRQLLISFLQHMAVQRRVRNPWEDENVVGIVNYVNIGLQVEVPMGTKGEGGPSRLVGAASWQANKNWLVKARAGTESVSAAIAFKAWWQPSFSVAAAASWAFRDRLPRFGLSFSLENYGDLRYERSSGQLQGGALVQRHVAQPEDLMNKEGKGVLVLEEDFDNPEILGQKPQVSEKYL